MKERSGLLESRVYLSDYGRISWRVVMHRGKLLAGRLAALLAEEKQIRDQGRRDRLARLLSRPRKRVEIIQQ